MTFTGMSSLSEGCTQGVDAELRLHELDGAWFYSPWLAATSCATASA
jgi:hypothetical protein